MKVLDASFLNDALLPGDLCWCQCRRTYMTLRCIWSMVRYDAIVCYTFDAENCACFPERSSHGDFYASDSRQSGLLG